MKAKMPNLFPCMQRCLNEAVAELSGSTHWKKDQLRRTRSEQTPGGAPFFPAFRAIIASGKLLANRTERLVNEGGTAETSTAHRLINCLTLISFSLFRGIFPEERQPWRFLNKRVSGLSRSDVDVMKPGSV